MSHNVQLNNILELYVSLQLFHDCKSILHFNELDRTYVKDFSFPYLGILLYIDWYLR